MKFKIGDTILIRGKIERCDNLGVAIKLDNSCFQTRISNSEVKDATLYPPDIPLPNQEVWVSDGGGNWLHGKYTGYRGDFVQFPHIVNLPENISNVYREVRTTNPHKENSIDLPKGKYSIETLKNLIAEHEK